MLLNKGTLLQGGKYRIVRHISNGGFGVTYEAEHVLLHKRLAIKEFFVKDFCDRDEQSNLVTVGTKSKVQLVSKLKRKFMDEAVAISSLSHPNIVNVSDVFEENCTAYYVMDYIDGKSLHQLVNEQGALPEAVAVDYIRQIADALQYVHSNNRLHLDIKPGNIMVDTHGKALLIDFGASKQYDEVEGENTSTLMGKTPGYAPIEQMGNRVQTFNPATDIYSLGATLYKLLSGTTPPDATELADDEELLPPLPKRVSDTTRGAVMKAMELKRKNRPQSMAEFINLLNQENKEQDKEEEECCDDDENTLYDTPDEKTVTQDTTEIFVPKKTNQSYMKYAIIGAVAVVVVIVAILLIPRGQNNSADESGDSLDVPPVTQLAKKENVQDMEYKNAEGVVTGHYTGHLVDGKMCGEGEFKFIDGGMAKGTFRNDRIVEGRMTTQDGYYFDGAFVDGLPHNGTWYAKDGTVNSQVKDGEEQ